MQFKSGITNRDIDFNDNIIIVNPKQAAFYWYDKNIPPVHIYPSRDRKTDEAIVVFVFQRSATQEAYREWMERR